MAKKVEKKQKEGSIDSAIEQILLHLSGSIDAGFSYTAKRGLFMLDDFSYKPKESNGEKIKNAIINLNKEKLIKKKRNYDGSIIISLTEKGKLRALNIKFRKFAERKEKWDGKWRMIMFDIPNECRKARDALRYRLKSGGFYELQKSIFLYPYDCEKEIKSFTELFKAQKYIRFALLDFIDNESDVCLFFHLREKTD